MQSNVTINPVLNMTATQYSAQQNQYVGRKLFPVLPVGVQAAGYYLFKPENMLNVPLLKARAPSAAYPRTKTSLDNATFNTKEYGIEESVDDRERKKYRAAFDADMAAVMRATRIVMVNQELRVQQIATGSSVPHSAITTPWSNYGVTTSGGVTTYNSNPFVDVNAAKEVIRLNAGLLPNKMLISEPVLNALKEHPAVIDKIKYTQTGITTEEILARAFGVDELLVARTVANSTNEGQALTPADIWGSDVILAYVDASPDLKSPTLGRVFSWSEEVGMEGMIVESYREDSIRADVHRVRDDADEELIAPQCGYRLTAALG